MSYFSCFFLLINLLIFFLISLNTEDGELELRKLYNRSNEDIETSCASITAYVFSSSQAAIIHLVLIKFTYQLELFSAVFSKEEKMKTLIVIQINRAFDHIS